MVEDLHPKVLHVAGKENDTADALSGLGMVGNSDDELEWETPLPPLTYQDEFQLLLPQAAEKEVKPTTTKSPLATDLIKY